MTFDEEQEFVAAAKFYVSNNLELKLKILQLEQADTTRKKLPKM